MDIFGGALFGLPHTPQHNINQDPNKEGPYTTFGVCLLNLLVCNPFHLPTPCNIHEEETKSLVTRLCVYLNFFYSKKLKKNFIHIKLNCFIFTTTI